MLAPSTAFDFTSAAAGIPLAFRWSVALLRCCAPRLVHTFLD